MRYRVPGERLEAVGALAAARVAARGERRAALAREHVRALLVVRAPLHLHTRHTGESVLKRSLLYIMNTKINNVIDERRMLWAKASYLIGREVGVAQLAAQEVAVGPQAPVHAPPRAQLAVQPRDVLVEAPRLLPARQSCVSERAGQ